MISCPGAVPCYASRVMFQLWSESAPRYVILASPGIACSAWSLPRRLGTTQDLAWYIGSALPWWLKRQIPPPDVLLPLILHIVSSHSRLTVVAASDIDERKFCVPRQYISPAAYTYHTEPWFIYWRHKIYGYKHWCCCYCWWGWRRTARLQQERRRRRLIIKNLPTVERRDSESLMPSLTPQPSYLPRQHRRRMQFPWMSSTFGGVLLFVTRAGRHNKWMCWAFWQN